MQAMSSSGVPPRTKVSRKTLDFNFEELREIVQRGNTSLKPIKRVSKEEYDCKQIIDTVIYKGIPLVIEDTTRDWDLKQFEPSWLKEHMGSQEMINSPRDNDACMDLQGWTVGKYIDYVSKPPHERHPPRLYGKDMACPEEWEKYIFNHLDNYFAYRGSSDLVSNLPSELQPLSLMIYVGVANSWTPGHKDICGSLGHNVMVYAEEGATAIWFMMKTEDKDKVAKYWNEKGGSIDHDNYFMSWQSLMNAPFDVYVVEQKVGDFVIVPPLCSHQVINKGGNSIKVAWNTITAHTIGYSYNTLPYVHKYTKPELYRIKATTYYSLLKLIDKVKKGEKDKRMIEEFEYLIDILSDVVYQETIDFNSIRLLSYCTIPRPKDFFDHYGKIRKPKVMKSTAYEDEDEFSEQEQPTSESTNETTPFVEKEKEELSQSDSMNINLPDLPCDLLLAELEFPKIPTVPTSPKCEIDSQLEDIDINNNIKNDSGSENNRNDSGSDINKNENSNDNSNIISKPQECDNLSDQTIETDENPKELTPIKSLHSRRRKATTQPNIDDDDTTPETPNSQKRQKKSPKKSTPTKSTPKNEVKLRTLDQILATIPKSHHKQILQLKSKIPEVEIEQFEDNVTKHNRICNFCNSDIFNLCFHCVECSSNDDVDFCLTCIAEGRGCIHKSTLALMSHLPPKQVEDVLSKAQNAYNEIKKKFGVTKRVTIPMVTKNKNVHPDGLVAFMRIFYHKQHKLVELNCHQCKRKKPMHYIVNCSRCAKRYCESCLWNRQGIKIKDCLVDKRWKCPSCKGICNCAVCLRQRGLDPKEYTVELQVNALEDVAVEFSQEHGKTSTRSDRRPKSKSYSDKSINREIKSPKSKLKKKIKTSPKTKKKKKLPKIDIENIPVTWIDVSLQIPMSLLETSEILAIEGPNANQLSELDMLQSKRSELEELLNGEKLIDITVQQSNNDFLDLQNCGEGQLRRGKRLSQVRISQRLTKNIRTRNSNFEDVMDVTPVTTNDIVVLSEIEIEKPVIDLSSSEDKLSNDIKETVVMETTSTITTSSVIEIPESEVIEKSKSTKKLSSKTAAKSEKKIKQQEIEIKKSISKEKEKTPEITKKVTEKSIEEKVTEKPTEKISDKVNDKTPKKLPEKDSTAEKSTEKVTLKRGRKQKVETPVDLTPEIPKTTSKTTPKTTSKTISNTTSNTTSKTTSNSPKTQKAKYDENNIVIEEFSEYAIPKDWEYCVECDDGGESLIICDKCDACYHIECMDLTEDSVDGPFYCPLCVKAPIVAKFNKTWWPGIVYYVDDVDDPKLKSFLLKTRKPDQFLIRFFQDHKFCWISRTKVVEYKIKREELYSIQSKKLKIALKEADEQEIESEKSRRELLRAFVEMQKK